jgi:hypothetical protein
MVHIAHAPLVRRGALLGLVVAASGSSGPSVPRQGPVVEEVRALFAAVNEAERSGEGTSRVHLVTDGAGYEKKEWKRVPSAAATSQSLIKAEVLRIDRRVRKAVIYLSSPSGDWANTTEYFFYEGGGTAFRFETHVTYRGYDFEHDRDLPPGPYVIEQRDYFATNGDVVRSLTKAFRKVSLEAIRLADLQRIETPRYRAVKDLPFAALLQ